MNKKMLEVRAKKNLLITSSRSMGIEQNEGV
jgi:hypothetical protein